MACTRGAASPNQVTQRRLFAASAGYCQNPACHLVLFIALEETTIHVAEMAHVFSANTSGPRGPGGLSEEERGSFGNLILLCANCHTMVDKAPEVFSDSIIATWKASHAHKLDELFGAALITSRGDARRLVKPLLGENKTIFLNYGPGSPESCNPESGMDVRWKRKVLTSVLPNNRRILRLVELSRDLLQPWELDTLEQFRQHVDDFEAFHLQDFAFDAAQFPNLMDQILEEEL